MPNTKSVDVYFLCLNNKQGRKNKCFGSYSINQRSFINNMQNAIYFYNLSLLMKDDLLCSKQVCIRRLLNAIYVEIVMKLISIDLTF